jgi:hypothetical protein
MIKKITAIFLILVVNVFLLTIVVLHHHHDGIPYFSLFEIEHHDDRENYSCVPVADDCAKDETTCQLDQNVDVIYKIEEDCHCFFCCSTHNHDKALLQAVLFYFTAGFTLPDAEEQSLRQPPYLISYHSIAATSGSGLRAPPVA